MSFNPKDDGHYIWDFMHLMSSNAVSPVKRELYVNWLNGLKECFPCETCRLHLISNLEKNPVEPYSKTNVSLFYHSWKLHDTVNEQLNKPTENRLTYDQAYAKWFKESAPGTSQPVTSTPIHSSVSYSQAPISQTPISNTPNIQNRNTRAPEFRNFRPSDRNQVQSQNRIPVQSNQSRPEYGAQNRTEYGAQNRTEYGAQNRLEYGVQNFQESRIENGYERYSVSAGKRDEVLQESEENSEHGAGSCTSCGILPPDLEKQDFKTFKESRRRKYLPKN